MGLADFPCLNHRNKGFKPLAPNDLAPPSTIAGAIDVFDKTQTVKQKPDSLLRPRFSDFG
jgi:hypothetical protein